MKKLKITVAMALMWGTCQFSFASSTEMVGGPGGKWYSRQCPAGQKIVGITGNTGGWVDDVSIICAPIANNAWSAPIVQPKVGSAPGLGAIIGIVVGGTSGNVASTCPQGTAVSGMRVFVGAEVPLDGDAVPGPHIHKLTPVCKSIASGSTRNGPGIEGSHPLGQWRVLSCPRNNYASGITGRSGEYLDSIRLDCTKLAGRVPEDTVIEVGGRGGDYATSVCPSGHRMIGMGVRKATSGRFLRTMRPICGSMPTWNPEHLALASLARMTNQPIADNLTVRLASRIGESGGGDSKTLLCPANQYVHSVESFHDKQVNSVRLRCRTVDHAKRKALPRFGAAKNNRDLLQCPPDTVATGIAARAGNGVLGVGAAIHSLRLRCFGDSQARSSKLIAILGDSYGAGEGAPDKNVHGGGAPTSERQKSRERRAAWANRMCHSSNVSGLSRAARDYTIAKRGAYDYRNFACSGAEIELGFVDGQENPPESRALIDPQIDQAHRWMKNMGKTSIDTVVISVGGNDAGFASRIADCAVTEITEIGTLGMAAGSCSEDPNYARDIDQGLSTLGRRFDLLAEKIRVLRPRRVLLRTYPNPLRNTDGELCNRTPPDGPRPAPATQSRAIYAVFGEINAGSYRLIEDTFLNPLNDRLREIANEHGWEIIDGWYEATDDKGVCALAGSRAFNQPSDAYVKQGNHNGAFHPNVKGYNLEKTVALEALSRTPQSSNRIMVIPSKAPVSLKGRLPVKKLKKSLPSKKPSKNPSPKK